MENEIKTISNQLKIQYMVFWIIPVALFIAFENNIFPVGYYADNVYMQYVLETISILVTVICVPIGLKLFKWVFFRRIEEATLPVALSRYRFWSGIRLLILGIAVCLNIYVSYTTLGNVGGLCALISLTASLFCWPAIKRLRTDLSL